MLAGSTKSCGCLRSERSRDFQKERHHSGKSSTPMAVHNDILRDYKIGAAKRGLDFSLTDEQFGALITSDCVYCGAIPSRKREKGKRFLLWNGIDRIASNTGYLFENCLPCCSTCNDMKGKLSLQEFLKAVTRIASNCAFEELMENLG